MDLQEPGRLVQSESCSSRPGSWRSTVAALPLLAARLRAQGLEVRPLADHLAAPC